MEIVYTQLLTSVRFIRFYISNFSHPVVYDDKVLKIFFCCLYLFVIVYYKQIN